jgi:NitT/TauT family transport system ATP-binding protein
MSLAFAEAVQPGSIALDVEGVSHRYEIDGKELQVLDNVSLSIAPGEFVALLGPSGSGKSTLLRLAAGLETPTTGRVEENGRPITAPNPDRILVFQDAMLFPWRTVRANIAIGLEARGLIREREHRIEDVLKLVKLEGFADFYPHQLSGGMAQRAALARALVNDPKLLLLDEPLGKLDSLTRLRMQKELLDLWKSAGFTALLVTHDVEEALLLADRVVVLSDRPASIVAEIRVDQPHPRRRDDATLVALRGSILEKLGISHDV